MHCVFEIRRFRRCLLIGRVKHITEVLGLYPLTALGCKRVKQMYDGRTSMYRGDRMV